MDHSSVVTMTLVRRITRAALVATTLMAGLAGCSGSESAAAPLPTPEPTATAVPVDFVRFFDADRPKVREETWHEITDIPADWPELVSLPRTLRSDDGSFVASTSPAGAHVLTGRLFFDPSENYAADLRQRLLDAGFVSNEFFETDIGMGDRLSFGDSRVAISAILGYAIVDVIE